MRKCYFAAAVLCLALATIAAAPTYTALILNNATSGTITLSPPAGALGTRVLTLPARTATLGTTTGTLTSGDCAKFDASGNIIAAGAACGTGSGSGDVVGPGGSTAGHFAIFDGTTGKLLKDTLAAPAASATTDATVASNISSGTLPCGRLPALTGDVTSSAGSCATTAAVQTNEKCITWDSTTSVAAQTITVPVEWSSYTITSVKSGVNGGGSFTANIKIGSTSVTSCSAISVSGATNTVTSCTAANTGSANDLINYVISSPSGTINQAWVCPVFTHTVN